MQYGRIAVLALMAMGLAGAAQAEEYCREYTQDVQVGGKMQKGFGTACLQPDGTWAIRTQAMTEEQAMEGVEAEPAHVEYAYEQPVYVQPQPVYYGGVVIGGHRHHHGRHWDRGPYFGHRHYW